LLDAILTMIGYYVIILTAAMVLIMLVVQIFKVLSFRRGHVEPTAPADEPDSRAKETSDERAIAAIAAVAYVLSTDRQLSVSAWSHIERSGFSPWKITSKSRQVPHSGG
jgi:hypothetical protein